MLRLRIRPESRRTLAHYDAHADSFWQGTRDHDVSQNLDALLGALARRRSPPFRILDLGCGPGRDLAELARRGHLPTGLDGASRFAEMARAHAGCEVLHQDFLALALPAEAFDGIFCNASLFHVPRADLPRVLVELRSALAPGGVLFASNPRGADVEGFQGDRYCCFMELDAWAQLFVDAGFTLLSHYYRPPNRPRPEQPWLAMVLGRP